MKPIRARNLFEYLLGELRRRQANLEVFVLQMVSYTVILIDREDIFGRLYPLGLQPLRVHVKPTRLSV